MIYDKRQILLNNARDEFNLQRVRGRISKYGGSIYRGVIPNYEWSKKYLGETYDKVILASKGIEKLGSKDNEFTVLGGWCVMRMRCLRNLTEGILIDPVTGDKLKLESVKQFTAWLAKTISLDQIVGAVGVSKANNYAMISEEALWGEKIARILEKNFNRKLTFQELNQVGAAIEAAEERKYKITEKYIEYVTQKSVNLTRIVDKDIFQDMIRGRDELFLKIDISLDEMARPLIENRTRFQGEEINKETLNNIYRYLNDISLVMFMYTGLYLSLLQSKGYVITPKGIIMEPWSHAASNESVLVFQSKLFVQNSGKNNYLVKGGINEPLGFIALDEASTFYCKRVGNNLDISETPNTYNFDIFSNGLNADDSIAFLDLARNKALNFGMNYFPYGKSRVALLKIIDISESFHLHKDIINTSNDTTVQKRRQIMSLRKEKSKLVLEQSQIIIQELDKMLNYIFT